MGRRLASGGGAHNRRSPEVPDRSRPGRRLVWYAACLAFGAIFALTIPFGRAAAALAAGVPLLLAGWLTRPLPPSERLIGFVGFAAGSLLAGQIAG